MRRAFVAAAGFALAEGQAADPGGVVHVSPGPDRFGRILLACVEPLDLTPRGLELAAVALRTLRGTFAATPGPAAEALVIAFAAANAAVIAENRPLSTGRWQRRICVGATGIALTGHDIVVAQAAPTQAILVQDGQVYAFPDVASWRGDYIPETEAIDMHPLGLTEDHTPRLFYSEAAPGDLIALCATSVGRVLGRDEDVAFKLYSGSLLTADLEGSVDRLERTLAENDIGDAFAVMATMLRLPHQARLRLLPRSRRRPAPRGRVKLAVPSSVTVSASGDQPAPYVPHLLTVPDPLVDTSPPAFEGVREVAIRAAEVVSPARSKSSQTFAARQRAMAAPGALSVSRYREPSGLPAEWRAFLPRGPGMHVPARLLAVSLALFLTIGGTGFAVGQQRDRAAHAAAALAEADTALRGAVEIPGSATMLVAEAEKALATARDAGASGEDLASRERAFLQVRDRVWGVQRLTDVVRLGALPDALGTGGVRLAISGSTLYLAKGNLYELDPDGERLVALLQKGDEVNGGVAGDLRDVSIDGGKVVAGDGAATYVRDEQGNWHRHELAIDDIGGLHEGVPVIAWGDAAYGLSWDGNIVRFEETSGGPLAKIWAPADENPDLQTARDLAIDGRIHVLLEDGRTLTYSRGALVATVSPFVVPTLNKAAFLAQAPFADDFYIVDPDSSVGENVGRIVRVNAGGDARQYLTPAGEPGNGPASALEGALAGAQDMAIDELTGTVYWVSGNEIWRAKLPLA